MNIGSVGSVPVLLFALLGLFVAVLAPFSSLLALLSPPTRPVVPARLSAGLLAPDRRVLIGSRGDRSGRKLTFFASETSGGDAVVVSPMVARGWASTHWQCEKRGTAL
jgi:hypothetical protein